MEECAQVTRKVLPTCGGANAYRPLPFGRRGSIAAGWGASGSPRQQLPCLRLWSAATMSQSSVSAFAARSWPPTCGGAMPRHGWTGLASQHHACEPSPLEGVPPHAQPLGLCRMDCPPGPSDRLLCSSGEQGWIGADLESERARSWGVRVGPGWPTPPSARSATSCLLSPRPAAATWPSTAWSSSWPPLRSPTSARSRSSPSCPGPGGCRTSAACSTRTAGWP
jgi:hypothetical protein